MGWTIKDLETGPRRSARVRFEEAGEEGDRVEIRAGCLLGRPRFVLEDDDSGGDDDSGDHSSSGEDDSGGS